MLAVRQVCEDVTLAMLIQDKLISFHPIILTTWHFLHYSTSVLQEEKFVLIDYYGMYQ